MALSIIMLRLEKGLLSSRESSARGSLFPQPRLIVDGKPVLLDDLTGHGWRLVREGSADGLADAALPGMQLITIGDGGWKEADGVMRAWFQRHGCSAALVRPDNYVFGTADSIAGARALIEEAAAMLGLAAVTH